MSNLKRKLSLFIIKWIGVLDEIEFNMCINVFRNYV